MKRKLSQHHNSPINLPAGHKKLTTRRDFLSHSVGAFAAAAAAPSIWSMLMGKAIAAGVTRSSSMPFLVFDLAGGAGLPGSFLVGRDDSGKIGLLPSYDRLGWNPHQSKVDSQFGLPMNGSSSTLFTQLVAAASPEARAHLRLGSFCHRGIDDSFSNPLSAVQLIARVSNPGEFLGRIVGTGTEFSGGKSKCAEESVAMKSLNITSLNDFIDSVGYGRTFAGLPEGVGSEVARSILDLSREQMKDFQRFSNGEKLTALSDPSYEALSKVSAVQAFDPRADAAASGVYNLRADSDPASPEVVQATIVMNALKGNSSSGVITIGGCDYHDNTATTGDAVDAIIGRQIGRAVELAYRLKKKFFFQILTDGGVSANMGTRQWSSDDGVKSMTIIGYFDPEVVPTQRRIQVGSFTTGQGADLSSLLGDQTMGVGHAVFANYLSLTGQLPLFSKHVKTSPINSGNLDSVLIF